MDLGIQAKTAVVMGASQGLGRAIAAQLASEGTNLVLTARNEAALTDLAKTLAETHSIKAQVHALDTSDAAAVEAFCARLTDEIHPDILIANTGGPPPTPALGADPADWAKAAQSLLFSVIRVIETATKGMAARGWGRVVVVGSTGIQQPIPNLAISNTLRGGIAGYCKTLSAEVASQGVTVNIVLPGRIDTARIAQLNEKRAELAGTTVEEIRRAAEAEIPAGRYGKPEEFAAAAVFLASAPAAYITGQMTRVDGGLVQSV